MFGHNPEYSMAHNAGDPLGLAPLPEDQELISPLSELRGRKNATDCPGNRNGQVFAFDKSEDDLSRSLNRRCHGRPLRLW